MKKLFLIPFALACTLAYANPSTSVTCLRVQNSVEPQAVEDARPSFSWRMESPARCQKQESYRIVVRRESDSAMVWDSGAVFSDTSSDIRYMGVGLQCGTSYLWDLTVRDADGDVHEASSRFVTGLMNPGLSAWKGAEWIGDTEPVLDAASTSVFSISSDFEIFKGTTAGFIFGAGDFRLSDAFQNQFNISGENWFKVVLDISGISSQAGPEIRVYRVGYSPEDKPSKPFLVINKSNYPDSNLASIVSRGTSHSLKVYVETGWMSFIIDGSKLTVDKVTPEDSGPSSFSVGNMSSPMQGAAKFHVSPMKRAGGDYISFPHLCSVGFAAEPGCDVTYSKYRISLEGQSECGPVFGGSGDLDLFSSLECVRIPKYRNQSAYAEDIVVINKTAGDIVEYVDPSRGGCKMLRSVIDIPSGRSISSARLYVSAMGVYDFHINGAKVGEDWFAPGDSQYRETITYQAYDVTSMLHGGKNVLGAELFPGWFTGYMTFTPSNLNFFGDHEALLSRLDVTYSDGTADTFVSNPETWKVFDGGPVRYGSFFQGERYDASRENAVAGWGSAAYDDSRWKRPEVIKMRSWADPKIVARFDTPVRLREILQAVRVMPVHSRDGHTYIYDMGVNMVGVPSVTIPAGWLKAGDVVTMRYAEQLYPGLEGDDPGYVARFGPEGLDIAGRPLFETTRAAMNTDFYIASGSGAVIIRPRSTWRGYQYIQITLPSHSGPLPEANVQGLVLSSCEVPTGTYEAQTLDGVTGELANRLFANIQRSQMGNFFTIPTDCPQRNERMGWTGDAQAYSRTAAYNADVLNFFRQWMVALRDDQGIGGNGDVPGGIGSTVPTYNKSDMTAFPDGTTWAAAVCMVPWQMYSQYGDRRIVEENLDAMCDWLNGMAYYRLSDEYPHLSAKTGGLADWLAMDRTTPPDIVNNAIYIHMMEVTAIMAEAVGQGDRARILRERHDQAKAEWNRAYVDPESHRTRTLDGAVLHTQTSYATPLNFNVFDEENTAYAAGFLAQLASDPNLSGPDPDAHAAAGDFKPWTITTGFSGTPNILPALSRNGFSSEAYAMFSCTELPSWLHPVTMGATSMWERWNSYEKAFAEKSSNSMNSFNHFALGSVGQWMYEYQLGITNEHCAGEAGYGHFVLQPLCGGCFTSLSGSYESAWGRIGSAWTSDGVGTMTSFTATVPANTSATLYLPVSESVIDFGFNEGASFRGTIVRNGLLTAIYELPSGTWKFTVGPESVTIE